MKKLLTVLSTISILSVSGGSVVACGGNKYDQKDDDGNSILIGGLGDLDIDSGDITIGDTISTQNILDEIISNNGDSSLRGKIISRFINLLSAQFLQKGADGVETDITKNPYLNDGLKASLTDAFTELKSSVEADVDSERDSYDDQYGKKAASKWQDMLEAKFPGIKDSKELKTKYIADKMLNDEDDNVNTRLLNILLNTNQQGIKWTDTEQLRPYLDDFKKATDKDAWVKNNLSKAQQLLWSTLKDHDYQENVITTDDYSKFTEVFNKEGSTVDYGTIKYAAPNKLDTLESGSNFASKGYLSNSQRFFLDKFYQTEAPVAISQVTIAYASGGSMDNGIDYEEDFHSKSPTSDDEKRIGHINYFLGNIDSNMSSIIAGQSFDDVTNKAVSNLMTLSDSTNFSQMERNVVYSFINGGSGAAKQTTIDKLVPEINRAGTDSMYAVLDQNKGILAYIDSDGLQIVRIEGFNLLNTANTASNSGTIGIETNEDNSKSINSDTTKELGSFKEFEKMNDTEKLDAIEKNYGLGGDLYDSLNSKVSNPYLHFLVNQSLVKGISGAHTAFDIMEAVKSYVKISQPSSGSQFTYWTGLMDYFYEIQYAGKDQGTKDSFEAFFDNCIVAGSSDAAKTLVNYVKAWIESVQTEVANDNIIKFIAAQETEKKTISENTNEGYPTKGIFATFNSDAFDAIAKKWTVYKEGQTDTRVDLNTVLTVHALGEIKTSSDDGENPTADQILDAAVTANKGLDKTQLDVESITTAGATIKAKSNSTVYTGSVNVTFTVSIPESKSTQPIDEFTIFSFDGVDMNEFKGGWL